MKYDEVWIGKTAHPKNKHGYGWMYTVCFIGSDGVMKTFLCSCLGNAQKLADKVRAGELK